MSVRRCITLGVVMLAASLMWPGGLAAANPFKALMEKIMPGSKAEKQMHDADADVDEVSLDDNVLIPEVPLKQHDLVAAYMNELAKELSARKLERVEKMRDGEVVVVTIGSDNLFAPNDTVLCPAASEFLKPYARLLREVGMYRMIVVGHTDDTGSEAYTDNLSRARANAVCEWLGRDQLSAIDLSYYALGGTDPLYDNSSHERRAANRRIEIYIIPDRLIIEMAKSGRLMYRKKS